jgi:ADP-heptose:LPS heptosyltransferase
MNSKTNTLPKWVRFRAAAYLRGKGLSMGVPSLIDGPLFPILAHEGTAFNISMGEAAQSHVVGTDLSIFNNNSFDNVVTKSSNSNINDLITKLKYNGHLIVFGEYRPKGSWQTKEDIYIDGVHLQIYKKLHGKSDNILPIKVVPQRKRACIARYGAIGDALQLTPVIHQLHDDGFDVTLNISPYTEAVYKNNPYVANIICQERNVIPNIELGDYWDYWRKEYDLYINLSESIEGKLLKVEGRTDFYTPANWRREKCDINYHDQHMILAGLPHSKYLLPELYFTREEIKAIEYELRPIKDKFIITWALRGSSHHKQYPFFQEVAKVWVKDHPDSVIITVGGPESIPMQVQHPQIIPLAGQWDIRRSFALASKSDLVIGPESAIVNGASCFDVPKICLLSHSSKNNLTKYWTNNYSLEPDTEVAPCYPCHQLHYSLESCPLVDLDIDGRSISNLPRCTTAVDPDRLYNTIETVYTKWLNR